MSRPITEGGGRVSVHKIWFLEVCVSKEWEPLSICAHTRREARDERLRYLSEATWMNKTWIRVRRYNCERSQVQGRV
jgi:hypothetical protein